MYVFWKCNGQFGCRGARVLGEVRADGRATPVGYGRMLVPPLALLPDDEGAEIVAKLKALELELANKVREIHKEANARALDIAPFLRTKA